MKTHICMASGPSLADEDVDLVRQFKMQNPDDCRVYTVKETALKAPWADVLYAADHDWWVNNEDRWRGFCGEKWTLENRASELFPELKAIKCRTEWKWSDTPGILATGGNSGFQIINMAALDFGPAPTQCRIILLGYDYGYDPKKQNKHWWDDQHPRKSRESNYLAWNKRLAAAAPLIPVPVLNATRTTAIQCFPQVILKDVLQ